MSRRRSRGVELPSSLLRFSFQPLLPSQARQVCRYSRRIRPFFAPYFSLATSHPGMAAAAAAKSENPKNPTDLNLAPPAPEETLDTQLPLSSDGAGEETKEKVDDLAVKTSDVEGSGVVTDVQKKMKRAERFGLPVQLSEKEKRNSRAERFGTVSAVDGSDALKQSEDLKRKARAERFGILQSTPTDEDAKKKARLARFGSLPPADSAEEDKKKARALRFSRPDSGSKANGKGLAEVKTAVVGKAVGGT